MLSRAAYRGGIPRGGRRVVARPGRAPHGRGEGRLRRNFGYDFSAGRGSWRRRALPDTPGPQDDLGNDAVVIVSDASYGSSASAGGAADEMRGGSTGMKKADELKMRLLAYVSGLDRGIAAFTSQQKTVDVLAAALERSADGPVMLTSSDTRAMDILQGRWRLVFSSGFGSGSLGGRQPGPPSAIVPFTLGQVFQDIDASKMQLDNVVELCFRVPSMPFSSDDPDPIVAQITLGHTFEVLDNSQVSITFESTQLDITTPWPDVMPLPSLPALKLPEVLQPTKDLRSATFRVTYMDSDMRITRGDRGELRVYVRGHD